jgi:hypothetical protein
MYLFYTECFKKLFITSRNITATVIKYLSKFKQYSLKEIKILLTFRKRHVTRINVIKVKCRQCTHS